MSNDVTSCPACRADMHKYREGMFDDRYGYPGLFALMACSRCGQLETNPPLDEDALPSLYGNYYPRSSIDVGGLVNQVGQPGGIRARIRRWWEGTNNQGQYYAQSGMRILDYGCGSGLSLLEAKALGAEAYGVEADPNVARVAQHYRLNIHIGKLTDETFPTVKFDLVVLNQVIEHVPDPVRLLKMLKARLSEKGRIIMSFPNAGSIYRKLFGRRWINWHIPYHLHHFNRKSFMTFAAQLDLEVIELRTVTPNLWTVLQFRTLGQTVLSGQPNPMWGQNVSKAPSDNPREFQKAESSRSRLMRRGMVYAKRLTLISTAALIGIANRIIDLLGQGDSFLVVLKPKAREE